MTEESKTCQLCGDSFHYDPVVYCDKCNSPYHEDCWIYHGKCSTSGCGSTKFITEAEHDPPRKHGASAGHVAQVDYGVTADDSQVSASDNVPFKETFNTKNNVSNSNNGATNNSITNTNNGDGHFYVNHTEFADNFTRLDPDTFWETFFQWSGVIALGLAMILGSPKHGPTNWQVMKVFCPLALLFSSLRIFTDCTYVLDNANRVLLYSYSVFGLTATYQVCSFSEISSVGVAAKYHSTKHGHYYTYSTVLSVPGGGCVKVSQEDRGFLTVHGFAHILAEHTGGKFLPASEEQSSLEANPFEIPMERTDVEWKKWYDLVRPGIWEILLFGAAAWACFTAVTH